MSTMMKFGLPTVLLLVAGGLTGYAPAASAQVQGKPLQNTGNNLCLAATTIADLAVTQGCLPLQTWARLQIVGTTEYLLRNINNGLCLAASSGTNALTTEVCSSIGGRQRWKVINTSPIVPTLAHYKSVFSGGFLTSNGVGPVFTAPAAVSPQAQKLQIWAY